MIEPGKNRGNNVMWKNNMKSTATKCPDVKPAMLVISFLLFISMLFAGIASANAPDSEGIKVHGRWEINVINPDGGVAQNVVFENALTISGKRALAMLISGSIIVRDSNGALYWDLQADTNGIVNTVECNDITGNLRAGANRDNDAARDTLSGDPANTGTQTMSRLMLVPDSCVLTDTFTIYKVSSGFITTTDQAPDGGPGDGIDHHPRFSSKLLPEPIVVALGQAVSLKVTFSFE